LLLRWDLGFIFVILHHYMLKIGLTGGIGSGKTTVAKVFEALGIPVYYSDEAAKRLMHTNEEIKAAITRHFGEASYSDGKLDRKYLAAQVFGNEEKLNLLNSITHPATIADAAAWIGQQSSPYIIKEAALLFESGSWEGLDRIIGVSAPEELRVARVMERDGVSKVEVMRRIQGQLNEEEKINRCDFVIINDEEQPVIPQVLSLHAQLLREA
jgi:dephospho-CoA kinase